jgi:hypothetical protein
MKIKLQSLVLGSIIAAIAVSAWASRGGVKAIRYLEATNGIGVECNNGTRTILDRNSSGEWCGGSDSGSFQCFRSESQTAEHVCR